MTEDSKPSAPPVYDRILSLDDPPGTEVVIIEDSGKLTLTATRSNVFMFHQTPVVLLQDRSGAHDAKRCRVVSEPVGEPHDGLPLFSAKDPSTEGSCS